MNIKKLLISGLSVGVLLMPSAAFAQTTGIAIPVQSANPSLTTKQDARLATLHTACDNAIQERLTSLGNDAGRINGLTKLSSVLKGQFTNLITTNTSGLTDLKTKCDADSDLITLRADYRSVFLNFRVYAVFLPQTNILVAADTMDVTVDNLTDLMNKLQSRVSAQGNPANLTALLSDMQAKISDAKTQYANAQSLVTPLTPSSFNTDPSGTETTLKNARADLRTGAQDLKTAFSDAKQIRAGLKPLTSASPSATPM